MNIRHWLRQLSLEEYAEVFERERIDVEALRLLGDAELKEMGLPLGPRMKLKAAIESLASTTAPQTSAVEGAAERRQLTILFCDLVGSTQLSRQLDPERLREVMQGYQQGCRTVIERYEGHIAQYLGDGLMVYFGFPRAHEDDAERAVRAALDIVGALNSGAAAATASPLKLQVRIGIATGPVVVGETGGGDASIPKLAVGETPNLAARLQGLAGPDEIIIGPSTRRLLGETFDYLDLGACTLKGIVEPVQATRVLGEASVEGRFEAKRGTRWAPLIGRESEITLLMARWEQALGGEGQVVLLSGEAGIGKSRITQALRERADTVAHQRLRFQCSPYNTSAALYPVIENIERSAGIARDHTPDQKLDKLEALFANGQPAPAETLALMAMLLALPGQRYPQLGYAPHKQQEKIFNVLLDRLERLAHSVPLLLIFEDAHWIDSTTQAWLDLLVTRLTALRALLLVTHRPEYVASWGSQAHVTTLTLNRLGKRHGIEIIDGVTKGKSLPHEVLEQILTKTDGVPLFVEELTKTVIEADWLEETAEGYRLKGPLPALAIPSTLQDSLMARLDRQPQVKELAQIAACIGREFTPDLLGEVAGLTATQRDEALAQLSTSQLIFRIANQDGAGYVFKHALVQDAAYESLLKSKRQHYHARIAQALAGPFLELGEKSPATVARHYTLAENTAEAFQWWRKAGASAMARNAPAEAIEHFNQAIDVLSRWNPGRDTDQAELGVQLQLGTAVNAIMGWADKRAGVAFERALSLCDETSSSEESIRALYGVGAYYTVKGDQLKAIGIMQRLLHSVDGGDDIDAKIAANFFTGIVKAMLGKVRDGFEHLRHAYALYGVGSRENQMLRFGQDYRPSLQHWLSKINWSMGFADRAAQYSRAAMQEARASQSPYMLGWAYGTVAQMESLTGIGEDLFDIGIQHNDEQGYGFWGAFIRVWKGAALIRKGQPQMALSTLEQAQAMVEAMGTGVISDRLACFKARARLALGDTAQGLADVEEALQVADRCGAEDFLSEIYCVRGELMIVSPQHDIGQAEASFKEAISVAQQQGTLAFELRAATAYTRYLISQSRRHEAAALLKPICDAFKEGFDQPDFVEAIRLLDEVA